MGKVFFRYVPPHNDEDIVASYGCRGKVEVALRVAGDEQTCRTAFADKQRRRVGADTVSGDANLVREQGAESVLSEHPRIRIQFLTDGRIDL